MSAIKHFITESIKKTELDEFLAKELDRAGYGGVEVTKTPLGTRVTIYAMKPGLIIGRRGQSIRDLSKTLEENFGIANPQIAVAEIEVPELNANIMASRVVSALQRGVHFRRAGFWALNQIMEAGALGVEIVIRGKLTSQRARYEKFRAGYLPKCGDPALKNLRAAVAHVKLKPGLEGIQVRIMPSDVKFPDKVILKPEIEAAAPIPEAAAEVVPTPQASTPPDELSTSAEASEAEAPALKEETAGDISQAA